MSDGPFIIERIFNAPVSTVWKAITDNAEMKKWYFNIADFKPEIGFEFNFAAGDSKKTYVHLCKVTGAIPEKKLSYTWRYEGYEGNSEVIFELFPEGDKTKLVLTHAGLETFPSDPSFAKENFAKGWAHIIGASLKNFVEGVNA